MMPLGWNIRKRISTSSTAASRNRKTPRRLTRLFAIRSNKDLALSRPFQIDFQDFQRFARLPGNGGPCFYQIPFRQLLKCGSTFP
jgi:hypothetical protein